MFSAELNYVLEAAFKEARGRNHQFFTIEHILFALSFDREGERILKAVGVDTKKLQKDIETFFDEQLESDESFETSQTPAVHRVLQRAILHMQSAGKNEIGISDVLVSVMTEEESHAVYFLAQQQVTRLDILDFISHGLSKEEAYASDGFGESDEEGSGDSSSESDLSLFLDDLSANAEEGSLDPVIGREKELERALKVLSRRTKNNPLFIGEPGVGKTAMANALAQRLHAGVGAKSLEDARLYSLNIGSLVAGTKFRGEFEGRLRKLFKFLEKQEKPIVFIDEIHTIVGAGATGSGSMDAANLLKPVLSGGAIRVIGSTTHEDYKKSFDKDRALSRRFTIIELDEPSQDEAFEILSGLREHYEDFHEVKLTDESLRAAVELSAKYINERALPDKAIDVIDEAGAANAFLGEEKRKEELGEKDIEPVVSAIAKVPVRSVSKSDERLLKDLGENLGRRVFGQDEAIRAVSMAVKRSRASLTADSRPVGSFLFTGPTGVGKTELAKALAEEMGIHFHRFDMSEYMEKHAVARLVGAPPGYVGYEEGGQLTDLVRKHPYCVVLFDEIEKAHADIYSILLQVMDDARLTDSQGKKADFRNAVIILTTNAGSQASASIGFGKSGRHDVRDEAIKKLFPPEFRNRLDETVHFHSLPEEVILSIVDKFIVELEGQLLSRGITFQLSDKAKEYLAKEGFNEELGARPMHRLIQREIKDALTDDILFGDLQRGGRVKIDFKKDKLKFSIEPLKQGGKAKEKKEEPVSES